jgi:putative Mg2+ transporter-C (MgtC) family protein
MPQLSDNIAQLLQDPQVDALFRVLVAGVVTAIVGLERGLAGKPVGVRTHALIGMGAAIFTPGGVQAFGGGDPASPTRTSPVMSTRAISEVTT